MRVRVKICGITNPADAELAASLGADMIGLNFYAQSPRFIDKETARSIVEVLPTGVEPVALFVEELITRIQSTIQPLNLRTVQMHGELNECLMSGTRCIAAFSVRDAVSLQNITAQLDLFASVGDVPFAILVDAHVPGQYGGTGQTAPWHLLADFKPGVPLILAGGLTPENVAEAIRIVRPYAVDVASGVESAPGKKDAEKMRRFIDAVRASSDS
ncbi:MAG: phosphoribosylanthranilate isomerase [Gemmataceae bacterium]|nr:phosphoribosylanthranilate isomerase [Gemmataceae bacterium]